MTQRKRVIRFLQRVIADLEQQNAAAGAIVPVRERPTARKQRNARRAASVVPPAKERRRRANRLSVRARRPARVPRARG
jgi:hypothetical protein